MKGQNDESAPIQLGELEAEVISAVWAQGEATVQDVKDALEPSRKLAYTTVMTVMTRLADKGMLTRRKEGRAYVYTPAYSRKKVAGSLLQSLIQRFYKGATASAIAHLLETDEDVGEAELDRLEELIQAKRQESRS
jgi:predicted transcriptional regulator